MLNANIKKVLARSGLHERLKVSFVRDLYWTVTDKRWIEARRKEVEFYRQVLEGLRPGDLIFDIGANAGDKTDVFLRLGARVVSVEPDETCQKVISEKFLKLRLTPKPVVIVGKAVSDKHETRTMWVDKPGSAINTLSDKWVSTLRGENKRFDDIVGTQEFGTQKSIEAITLEELIVAHGIPYFVKIDVEGHEYSALKGLERPVPYLSFEVNLPEFRPEAAQCVELLARIEPKGKFNYSADCHVGLLLQLWQEKQRFLDVLGKIEDKSVEVFWKTTTGN